MLQSIVLIFAAFLLMVPPTYADDQAKEKWDSKGKEISDLYKNDPDGCNKVFLMLWDEAKKGDLNARSVLLYQMTMMHGPDMLLPGGSSDFLTRRRHYIIMAAHSIGADLEITADGKYYSEIILEGMMGVDPKKDFGQCMQKLHSHECVKILEKDTIPSFDVFASEIDTFIKAGYKARCTKNHEEKMTLTK